MMFVKLELEWLEIVAVRTKYSKHGSNHLTDPWVFQQGFAAASQYDSMCRMNQKIFSFISSLIF